MEGLLQILVLVGFIVGGAVLARLKAAPPPRFVDALIKGALWSLLFVMGFRIGNDRSLAARLGEMGLLALATAVFAVGATLAAVGLGSRLLRLARPKGRPDATGAPAMVGAPLPVAQNGVSRATGTPSPDPVGPSGRKGGFASFKAPALLLGIVLGGFVVGLLLPELGGARLSTATTWALDALLFLIGMQFVQSGVSLKGSFLRPETLLTPLATAFGTLASGLLLLPLFGLGLGKALSLSAGFGWYSLSGVLIADLGDPALGSAAFLANMARETLAFILIPLLAPRRPALAIGVAGATAMDVTLPLIEQCAGPEAVPASFASGALLSLSVPILVPLLYGLG
ncbi:MAG: lysine exporter LysO family protein [Spirochaetaceae bacterium]|nr:lysine exporter LysO family protein [Spirochaetaceae bacterium]